jgi:agmatinase
MSLKSGKLSIPLEFMGSSKNYIDSSIVLVGVPMDFTCSFRPGTRFGPQKIREVSIGIEEYSIYMDKSLDDASFYDSGDLDLPIGNVEKSLEIIEEAAGEILNDGKFPLFIGGEHLISVPVIKKVYEKYKEELVLIHFDAHADLREDYLGCPMSHASAIRRVIDFMPSKNIYQFGIRSGTKEEFQFANRNTNMFTLEVYEPLKAVIDKFKDKPIYITLDIDVLDPAYANGTGTPEPGGISSNELIKSMGLLKDLNIVGFDIVEVSPHYDLSDRTAILAAKIIRDVILMVSDYENN